MVAVATFGETYALSTGLERVLLNESTTHPSKASRDKEMQEENDRKKRKESATAASVKFITFLLSVFSVQCSMCDVRVSVVPPFFIQTWHCCYLFYFCSQTHFSRFFSVFSFFVPAAPCIFHFLSISCTHTLNDTKAQLAATPPCFCIHSTCYCCWCSADGCLRLLLLFHIYNFLEDSLVDSGRTFGRCRVMVRSPFSLSLSLPLRHMREL